MKIKVEWKLNNTSCREVCPITRAEFKACVGWWAFLPGTWDAIDILHIIEHHYAARLSPVSLLADVMLLSTDDSQLSGCKEIIEVDDAIIRDSFRERIFGLTPLCKQ